MKIIQGKNKYTCTPLSKVTRHMTNERKKSVIHITKGWSPQYITPFKKKIKDIQQSNTKMGKRYETDIS